MTDKYAVPINGVDRYAVLGNPISHSKSPEIHAAFAKKTGQKLSYEAVLAPLDGFATTVKSLVAQGFKGANVTVPFKFEAFALCDDLSEWAKAAGAVNTLIFEYGKIKGENTDGIGLVQDIQNNLNIQFDNKRVLLLGAGGAASGVLLPLLLALPSEIVIANRDVAKVQNLVENIKKSEAFKKNPQPVEIRASAYEDLSDNSFEIIINATSAGLTDSELPLPKSIFAKNCLAYDMIYGRETKFMKLARENGARVVDGLGMLVEQAAYSFWLWRNVNPQTAPVIAMLRNN